jgi:phosphoglycerate kinase
MTSIPTLESLGDVAGKKVLVRTDFNVPLEYASDGTAIITDDFRIRAALPTIEWLTSHGAQVVCASHLGRPKGAPEPKYSMAPVRERLAELAPGVELLENLRFDAGEEANDPAFTARLIEGIRYVCQRCFWCLASSPCFHCRSASTLAVRDGTSSRPRG